jgi:hypothetical protein
MNPQSPDEKLVILSLAFLGGRSMHIMFLSFCEASDSILLATNISRFFPHSNIYAATMVVWERFR